jgi:hypothetical protein
VFRFGIRLYERLENFYFICPLISWRNSFRGVGFHWVVLEFVGISAFIFVVFKFVGHFLYFLWAFHFINLPSFRFYLSLGCIYKNYTVGVFLMTVIYKIYTVGVFLMTGCVYPKPWLVRVCPKPWLCVFAPNCDWCAFPQTLTVLMALSTL